MELERAKEKRGINSGHCWRPESYILVAFPKAVEPYPVRLLNVAILRIDEEVKGRRWATALREANEDGRHAGRWLLTLVSENAQRLAATDRG